MRPLTLVMSAFGPYADRVELNLDSLGENGLYLITGRTGSGKTTVFDAISFALYGEASGSERQPNMLRSKYALPETPTYVELTFAYKGKTYKVLRNPEYERPARRGGGMTRQTAGAELTMPDQTVISRLRDVNDKIIEILGVDRERFSQIAMIAQGDFMRLLTAETSTRQIIFRKIFHTDRFGLLQEELKREFNAIGKTYDAARNAFTEYASMLSCAEDSPCMPALTLLRSGGLPDEDVLQLAEDLLAEDARRLQQLTEAEEKRSGSLARLNHLIGKADQIEKAQAALRQYSEELTEALKEEETSKIRLKAAEEKGPEKTALQEQVTLLTSMLGKYEQLDMKQAELKEMQKKLQKQTRERDDWEKARKELGDTLASAEEELQRLSDAVDLHAAAQAGMRAAEDKLLQLDQLLPLPDQWRLQEQAAGKAVSEYEQEKNRFVQARERYERLNDSFMDAQAGILASQLTDGQPCPVCGSLDHPHPAVSLEGAADEASVKKAKKAYEQAQKSREEKSRKAGSLKGAADEKKAFLAEQLAGYAGGGPLAGEDFSAWLEKAERALLIYVSDLRKKKADCAKRIEIERKRRDRKEKLEGSLLPDYRRRMEQSRQSIASMQEEIAGLERQAEEKTAQLREMQAELAFPDQAQAKAHIHALEEQVCLLEQEEKAAREKADQIRARIQRLTGSIAGQKDFLEEAGQVDRAGTEAQIKVLEQEALADKAVRTELTGRSTQNRTALDKLSGILAQMKDLQERRQIAGPLSMTANGNIQGKEKIMLETYVQMRYFDRIIDRANTRFMVMSGGQFELRRQKTASNNRTQSGLELCIKDHHSGTERSVKTLSGGESFMAALSMALGLSDEIQAQSGGIRLDTMFVDEGFGTLDDESLELAMRALLRMAGSGRLIGIISHVDTLKTRIEKQLQTSKDADGKSSIRIVLP